MGFLKSIFDNESENITKNILYEYEESIARIVLLCIEALPFCVGVSKVAQILMGRQTIFLTEHGVVENPMFGKLQQFSKMELTYIIKMLAVRRYIVVHEEQKVFDVVSVSPKGTSFLEGRRKLDFHFLDTICETHVVPADEDDIRLAHALKDCRIELAMNDTGKAYDICDDVTLLKIANLRPATIEELAAIDGIDSDFVNNYGIEFIKVINDKGTVG